MLGFKSMKTAYAKIIDIEVIIALHKGQTESFYFGPHLNEMHQMSRVFKMQGTIIRGRLENGKYPTLSLIFKQE